MGKKNKKDNKKSKKKSPSTVDDWLPAFRASRGPITYDLYDPGFDHYGSDSGEVTHMNIHKLASVGALVAFAAAALGHAVFGYTGLELVAGGLFLHAGADLLEDVLS